MIQLNKWINIGATARQSGKTELACRIITHFYKEIKIIGVKISTIHKGDSLFHGNIAKLDKNFIIEKNIFSGKEKSTDRMLTAGASEVFWVHVKAEFYNEMLQKLIPQIDKNAFVVCESNSLIKYAKPDVFLMINKQNTAIKDSASDVIKKAHHIIEYNGKEFLNFELSGIHINNEQWILT